MKKSFLIVGLGRFGQAVAEELAKQNADVMAIDNREEAVIEASENVEHCMICDSTNENAMRQLGLDHINHAIVTIGDNVEATILTTIILKEIGIKKISVRVDNEYYTKIMQKLGADEIIFPEKIAGVRYANSVISDTFVDYFNISDDYALVQISIVSSFKPRTLVELDSRNKYDVSIVSIKRHNKVFIPKGSDSILPDDEILVIGVKNKITKFDQQINN